MSDGWTAVIVSQLLDEISLQGIAEVHNSSIEQLRTQLMAAQAAMDEARKYAMANGKIILDKALAGDRSALNAAIAEAKTEAEVSGWHKGFADACKANEENKIRLIAETRKPLVDALDALTTCPIVLGLRSAIRDSAAKRNVEDEYKAARAALPQVK